jgi:NAD-dependent deacetylase
MASQMQENSDLQKLADKVAKYLVNAQRVTFLTGAGVSKESGIPTFRDAQTGMWEKYNPQELATPEGFKRDPKLVWQWYDYRRKLLGAAEPNAGHRAIVEMESLVPKVSVITQNIDGLHQKAGSTDVTELHGSIKRFYCFEGGHDATNVPFDLEEPPRCHCGSMIRPGVVWFGEALPPHAMSRGLSECQTSEVVFVVGTSALVQPAASLPYAAHKRGARLVEVNPEETPITDITDVFLQGASGVTLPLVVAELRRLKGKG